MISLSIEFNSDSQWLIVNNSGYLHGYIFFALPVKEYLKFYFPKGLSHFIWIYRPHCSKHCPLRQKFIDEW